MPNMTKRVANKTGGAKRKPNRAGKPLHVYIRPELRDALDAEVEASRPRTSATALVELALEEYLRKTGRLPAGGNGD